MLQRRFREVEEAEHVGAERPLDSLGPSHGDAGIAHSFRVLKQESA
jgi:hypothetical protein